MAEKKKYAAVFTDSRPLMNLDICAADHMKFLPKDWDCVFMTSAKNAYVTRMGAKLIEIHEATTDTYEKFNNYRASIDMWSKLLEYDRVLIFEQDTRLLRTGIEEFLEWDYIGAPWPEHEKWHKGNRVGNGGLSLRNPAMMLRVVQYVKKPGHIENEDHYFALNMKELGVNVAPLEVAQKFSCEKKFTLGTLGCHAINKHMTPEQVEEILGQYGNASRPADADQRGWLATASNSAVTDAATQKIMAKLKRHEEILEGLWNRVDSLHKRGRIDWSWLKRPEEPIFKWAAKILLKHSKYPRGVFKQYKPKKLVYPKYRRPKLDKFPSFAICTPSLNQGQFIEATIKSIVEQDYPNVDYHVQDGLSTDNTMEIVKKYAEKYNFSYSSQKDKNHSQAINRGFANVEGEIMGFVNSDDLLCPNALYIVADYFNKHPEVDVVYGHRFIIDENGDETGRWYLGQHSNDELRYMCSIPQETMFWRRSIWEKSGGCIDESYYFNLDWEFEVRMMNAGGKFVRIPYLLGAFRVHPTHKSSTLWETVGHKDTERMHLVEFGGKLPRQERVWYFCNYAIVRSFLYQTFGNIF